MNDFIDSGEKSAAKSIVGDVYLNLKTFYKRLDISQTKYQSYTDGLRRSLSNIQIMGMADPRQLTDLYVTLKFKGTSASDFKKTRGPISSSKFDDISYLKKCLKTGLKKGDIDQSLADLGYDSNFFTGLVDQPEAPSEEQLKRIDVKYDAKLHGVNAIGIVDKYKNIVVLAGPGSGKTTFLKYCALAYSGHLPVSKKLSPKLPIFVPLRELSRAGEPDGSPDWLVKAASLFASDVSDQSFTVDWLNAQLTKGNCFLLLDGLDEVPEASMNLCLQSIKAFSQKYSKNRIMLSCRKPAYKKGIVGFTAFEIENFAEADTAAFARNWFGSDTLTADRFLADLASSESAASLCKTPLLATLLCIMYGYARSLPSHRAELYERCVDALMFHWDTYRAIDRSSISGSLSPARKKYLLAQVARVSFEDNAYLFRRSSLLKLLTDGIERLGLQSEVSSTGLLDEIQDNHGLLVERSPGIFAFSHLSFHEYFCAYSYTHSNDISELFQLYRNDVRFGEILLLTIEMSFDPSALILGLIGLAKNDGPQSAGARELCRSVLRLGVPMDERLRHVLRDVILNSKVQKPQTRQAEAEREVDAVDELLEFELRPDENWTDDPFEEDSK